MTSKKRVREEIKAAVTKLSLQERLEKSQLVSSHLWDLVDSFAGHDISVGLYAPLPDEVDIFSLDDRGFHYPCSFPFGEGAEDFSMSFRKSSFDDLEVSHRFGVTIRTPNELTEVVSPTLIVVPGVSFSEKGERLGRGKGYYDRYLSSFKGIKVGVCFKEQLRSELPCDDHDQLMDFVVSEAGVFNCQGLEDK